MMDLIQKEIGQMLKAYRKAHGMTQAQVAVALNRSNVCISKYESGIISMDLRLFFDYCKLLQVDPIHLLNICYDNNIGKRTPESSQLSAFYQRAPLYMYWIDPISQKIVPAVIELSVTTGCATMYLYFDNISSYHNSKVLLTGKLESFAPFSRGIMQKINDPSDMIYFLLYNVGEGSAFRLGQLNILTRYFQPTVTKCAVFHRPVSYFDQLFELLSVSKEELHNFKKTNSFFVYNSAPTASETHNTFSI